MKFVYAVLALTVIGFSSFVFAHTNLASSSPGDGAQVKDVTEIQLVFSAAVRLTAMKLHNTNGTEIALESISADSAEMHTIALGKALAPGRYAASWRSISSDSHVVNGELRFIVVD